MSARSPTASARNALTDNDCDGSAVCRISDNTCVECIDDSTCGNDVCDASNGVCTECLTDNDCDGSAICRNSDNTCVECIDDSTCGDDVCDVSNGVCTECLTDNDCDGSAVCRLSDNSCVECIDDSTCGDDVCDVSNGVCTECLTDNDCDGSAVCRISDNTCVECVTHEDCAGTPGMPACDDQTNTCVECVPGESGFCDESQVCDPGSNACVECLSGSDCSPGTPVCDPDSSTCVECTPEDLSACASGEVCNPDDGTCVECLSNDHCGGGLFCSSDNTCVTCLSDADCDDQNECTADRCSASGECAYSPAECSVVTDSSLCRFDEYPAACGAGREFKLVFTPDVKIWPGYKLSSSNPGQTYYNLITEEQPSVTVEVPYPYVTVGAMPVHVYCGDDLQYDSRRCFVPPAAVAVYPLRISMADWATGGRCAVLPPGPGDDTYPMGAGTCALEIPLPAGQCAGKYYVNVHLDYGLEGAAARYDAVGMSAWGSSDAYVDDQAIVAINDCTPYTFSDSGSDMSDTVFSTNIFKRLAGVISAVGDSSTGSPVAGVKASLREKATGEVVSTATGDEDGYLMLNYKHVGKATVFTLTINIPGSGVVSTDLTLRANGWAEASYDVATRRWSVISSSDK
jgi:hypothetical protein